MWEAGVPAVHMLLACPIVLELLECPTYPRLFQGTPKESIARVERTVPEEKLMADIQRVAHTQKQLHRECFYFSNF